MKRSLGSMVHHLSFIRFSRIFLKEMCTTPSNHLSIKAQTLFSSESEYPQKPDTTLRSAQSFPQKSIALNLHFVVVSPNQLAFCNFAFAILLLQ
jgi:hypothetical protein